MKTRFVVREAVAGLSRNATMTVAMIITTAISLALLATGVLITTMTNETKDIYLDRIEVMIQFDGDVSANDHDCSSDECRAVKEKLESDGGVERVTFRNREQSFDRFRQLFGQ